MTTMAVTQARANLRFAISMVKAGEEVQITQNGEVVAVLVHPDVLKARRVTPAIERGADLLSQLQRARRDGLPSGTGLSAERAEALVQEVRAGREAR